MMGSTHKAIGVATGVSFVLAGVMTGNPVLALAMLSAPVGAMLPDIDHNNSKIGRARKNTFDAVEKIALLAFILLIISLITLGFIRGMVVQYILGAIIISVPFGLCMAVTGNQKLKKKFKFFTKHRGIMHTLTVPAALVIGAAWCGSGALAAIVQGFVAGYLSHLVADVLTVEGCPIFWPITEKPFHMLPIRTNTVAEKAVAVILAGGIIWIGYWLVPYLTAN